MFDLGSIVARVVADVSGFKKSLTETTTQLKTYATGFKGQMGKVNSVIETHKDKLQKISLGVGILGATAAATARGLISLASDQAEVLNKTKEIFGKASDEIIKKSKESATAVGASTTEYLNMASGIGNLLVPMGYMKDEAAGISANMVTLAADLGSFNNTTTEDALNAISAGFRGESEALRRYGVQLSAARVEEEALALGLVKTKKEIDSKAKAQATLSLIMKDTAAAQGDFTRTSEGYANQAKIQRAEMANLSTEIGTHLLPLAIELQKMVRSITSLFAGLSEEQRKVVAYVLAFVAAIGVVMPPIMFLISMIPTLTAAFSALGTVIAFLGGPISLLIAAVGLLFVAWKTNFLGIRDITATVWQTIKDTFTLGGMFIQDAWKAALNAISTISEAVFENIKTVFKNVINYFIEQINSLISMVNSVSKKLTFGKFDAGISAIPKLAEGGIVTRPTLAMIGEGGESEAVIPLSKLGSVGGAGGVNIIIQDSIVADEETAKNLLEKAFNAMNLAT